MKKIEVTPVIMHPEAFSLKGSGTGSPVTEAVKNDTYTLLPERRYLIKNIHYTPIVGRVRDIEAYHMNCTAIPGIHSRSLKICTNLAKKIFRIFLILNLEETIFLWLQQIEDESYHSRNK